MSRSYKKTPRYGDINKKSVRTLANSYVRAKLKDNPDCISFSKSNAYRKLFDSYNICEFNYFVIGILIGVIFKIKLNNMDFP